MANTKTINIGGEDRPIKFGINQSILYCELRDISITEMSKDMEKFINGSGAELRDFMWSALKDGARKEKIDFDYTPEDIGDWMEDMSEEEMEKFFAGMIEDNPPSKKKELKVEQK